MEFDSVVFLQSVEMASVSRFVLVTSFLMHTQIIFGQFMWYVFATNEVVSSGLVLFQGIMYLLYPLCGWIADTYLSNFKAIKFSFFAALFSSLLTFLTSLYSLFNPSAHTSVVVFSSISGLSGMLGLGLYEANAIQFALNQMVEASSEQLSSFVYWYIWCTNVAPLFMYYFSLGILYSLNCIIEIEEIDHGVRKFFFLFININSSLILILLLLNLSFALYYQKYLYIEEIKRNPLKTVIQVLKYSYRHKQPEHTSAFYYWENKIPSRIDFGKSKYGGPFTYEQVEDVKTMFMLLLLILSLFGFHVSGNGFSLSNFIMHTMGCPSIGPFVVLFMNPMHISLVLTSLEIPVYLFTRKYTVKYIPSMVSKLKAGLFLCLLNEALLCGYSLLIPEQPFDCSYLVNNISYYGSKPPLIMQCLTSNFKIIGSITNNTCVSVCASVPINDSVLYLAFIPLILKGLSYLLVFVTTLEFICAQAPNAINGFMIGIWYSMLCINYSGIDLIEILFQRANITTWNIYHGSKGLLIFLSIILFSVSSKHYHFRERSEIVNEQAMIEEIYERELLLNNNEQHVLYSVDDSD